MGKEKSIYNPFGVNVSGFFHKNKDIQKGTRKFRKIMKKWKKENERTIPF